MKLVETVMRFEQHLRQAQENAKRDLTDYFVYTARVAQRAKELGLD